MYTTAMLTIVSILLKKTEDKGQISQKGKATKIDNRRPIACYIFGNKVQLTDRNIANTIDSANFLLLFFHQEATTVQSTSYQSFQKIPYLILPFLPIINKRVFVHYISFSLVTIVGKVRVVGLVLYITNSEVMVNKNVLSLAQ